MGGLNLGILGVDWLTLYGNYFAQGSSYWYALGLLLDGGGSNVSEAIR